MPNADVIRSEVEKILASPGFENAERLKQLLRYTTEKALDGTSSELKEYTIGVDVFGRGDQFDPKVDSIVRVTAGKLRLKLKEYYLSRTPSRIRIEYPPGTYAPDFIECTLARRQPWGLWLSVALILLLLAGVVAAVVSSGRNPRRTLKKLTSFSAVTRDAAISRDGKLVAYVPNRESKEFRLYVQQVSGGTPLRRADSDGDFQNPDFSPDGSTIAFVRRAPPPSFDSGVYLIPTLGGTPVRIADGDANPRFSPDGQSVVYSKGLNRILVVSVRGGQPKQISPSSFNFASSAIFTPDGKHILFYGRPDKIVDFGRDWWVISLETGKLVQTGAKQVIRVAEQLAELPWYCHPTGWLGGRVLFWCDFRLRSNLFTVPIDYRTWKVSGPLDRITFGSGGHEHSPSASESGRIIFTTSNRSVDVQSVEGNASTGDFKQSSLRPVTRRGTDLHHITIAGARMSYNLSNFPGEVWSRDLATGQEQMLASGRVFRSVISPDGRWVAYHEPRDGGSRIVVTPFEGGEKKTLCENCQLVQGWTPDSRRVIWGWTNYKGLSAVDVATGAQETWIEPNRSVQAGGFSPDGKWLSLSIPDVQGSKPTGFVVPYRDGRLASERDWVTIRSGGEQMHWSPDGHMLYFLSAADGYLCLYAQRLQRSDKHPSGDPVGVYHLHSPERSLFGTWMTPYNFAVAHDRVYLTVVRQQSDIWMLE